MRKKQEAKHANKKIWKRRLLAGLIACGIFVTTGCGQVIDLTDEENHLIAEYAAELLLKYDRNYDTRYNPDELEDTTETGTDSTATGTDTTATGSDTTATGSDTTATGDNTTAPTNVDGTSTTKTPSSPSTGENVAFALLGAALLAASAGLMVFSRKKKA